MGVGKRVGCVGVEVVAGIAGPMSEGTVALTGVVTITEVETMDRLERLVEG